MTLDRVAQAPDAREEDTSGGFRQGGWHLRQRRRDLLVVGSTHLVQTMAGTTWSITCS